MIAAPYVSVAAASFGTASNFPLSKCQNMQENCRRHIGQQLGWVTYSKERRLYIKYHNACPVLVKTSVCAEVFQSGQQLYCCLMIKNRIERYNNFKCIRCSAFYFEIVFVVFAISLFHGQALHLICPKVKLSTSYVPRSNSPP